MKVRNVNPNSMFSLPSICFDRGVYWDLILFSRFTCSTLHRFTSKYMLKKRSWYQFLRTSYSIITFLFVFCCWKEGSFKGRVKIDMKLCSKELIWQSMIINYLQCIYMNNKRKQLVTESINLTFSEKCVSSVNLLIKRLLK